MTVLTTPLTEAAFMAQITDLARLTNWRVYHTRDSRGSDRGWVDLVLCRPPEILFVELKTSKGRTTRDQDEWLYALTLCGLEARVWRPGDWPEIEKRLFRGRKPVRKVAA